jgi:type II secretory pathway pseudopilin PulG
MIEAVVAMVIVGVMLVAALNTVGAARSGETSLTDARFAGSLAQDLLAEINVQAYADSTDTAASFGPSPAESATGNRSLFNDVNDYLAFTETPILARDGSVLSADKSWTRTATVGFLNPADATTIVKTDQGLARITVEVRHRGLLRASIVGLRTRGLPDTVACALPNGSCVNLAPAHCVAQGGTPGAAGSNCWTTAETTGGVARTGLVSLWAMDDLLGGPLGLTASDRVGSNTATLKSGATFSGGHTGNALTLDGVNDYATVPHDASLSLPTTLTLAGWISLQTIPGAGVYQTVLHKGATTTARNYFLQVVGGQLSFGFHDTSGSLQRFTGGTVATANRWYHVAATFDKAASQVALYIDGALVRTWSTSKFPATNTGALTIGKSPYGDYLTGKIDDLRVYGRVLSSSEVNVLYNGGEP